MRYKTRQDHYNRHNDDDYDSDDDDSTTTTTTTPAATTLTTAMLRDLACSSGCRCSSTPRDSDDQTLKPGPRDHVLSLELQGAGFCSREL